MAEDTRTRNWVYDTLNKEGYDMGSREDYENNIDNDETSNWAYNTLSKAGYDMGTQDEFKSAIKRETPSAPTQQPTGIQTTGALGNVDEDGYAVSQQQQQQQVAKPANVDMSQIPQPFIEGARKSRKDLTDEQIAYAWSNPDVQADYNAWQEQVMKQQQLGQQQPQQKQVQQQRQQANVDFRSVPKGFVEFAGIKGIKDKNQIAELWSVKDNRKVYDTWAKAMEAGGQPVGQQQQKIAHKQGVTAGSVKIAKPTQMTHTVVKDGVTLHYYTTDVNDKDSKQRHYNPADIAKLEQKHHYQPTAKKQIEKPYQISQFEWSRMDDKTKLQKRKELGYNDNWDVYLGNAGTSRKGEYKYLGIDGTVDKSEAYYNSAAKQAQRAQNQAVWRANAQEKAAARQREIARNAENVRLSMPNKGTITKNANGEDQYNYSLGDLAEQNAFGHGVVGFNEDMTPTNVDQATTYNYTDNEGKNHIVDMYGNDYADKTLKDNNGQEYTITAGDQATGAIDQRIKNKSTRWSQYAIEDEVMRRWREKQEADQKKAEDLYKEVSNATMGTSGNAYATYGAGKITEKSMSPEKAEEDVEDVMHSMMLDDTWRGLMIDSAIKNGMSVDDYITNVMKPKFISKDEEGDYSGAAYNELVQKHYKPKNAGDSSLQRLMTESTTGKLASYIFLPKSARQMMQDGQSRWQEQKRLAEMNGQDTEKFLGYDAEDWGTFGSTLLIDLPLFSVAGRIAAPVTKYVTPYASNLISKIPGVSSIINSIGGKAFDEGVASILNGGFNFGAYEGISDVATQLYAKNRWDPVDTTEAMIHGFALGSLMHVAGIPAKGAFGVIGEDIESKAGQKALKGLSYITDLGTRTEAMVLDSYRQFDGKLDEFDWESATMECLKTNLSFDIVGWGQRKSGEEALKHSVSFNDGELKSLVGDGKKTYKVAVIDENGKVKRDENGNVVTEKKTFDTGKDVHSLLNAIKADKEANHGTSPLLNAISNDNSITEDAKNKLYTALTGRQYVSIDATSMAIEEDTENKGYVVKMIDPCQRVKNVHSFKTLEEARAYAQSRRSEVARNKQIFLEQCDDNRAVAENEDRAINDVIEAENRRTGAEGTKNPLTRATVLDLLRTKRAGGKVHGQGERICMAVEARLREISKNDPSAPKRNAIKATIEQQLGLKEGSVDKLLKKNYDTLTDAEKKIVTSYRDELEKSVTAYNAESMHGLNSANATAFAERVIAFEKIDAELRDAVNDFDQDELNAVNAGRQALEIAYTNDVFKGNHKELIRKWLDAYHENEKVARGLNEDMQAYDKQLREQWSQFEHKVSDSDTGDGTLMTAKMKVGHADGTPGMDEHEVYILSGDDEHGMCSIYDTVTGERPMVFSNELYDHDSKDINQMVQDERQRLMQEREEWIKGNLTPDMMAGQEFRIRVGGVNVGAHIVMDESGNPLMEVDAQGKQRYIVELEDGKTRKAFTLDEMNRAHRDAIGADISTNTEWMPDETAQKLAAPNWNMNNMRDVGMNVGYRPEEVQAAEESWEVPTDENGHEIWHKAPIEALEQRLANPDKYKTEQKVELAKKQVDEATKEVEDMQKSLEEHSKKEPKLSDYDYPDDYDAAHGDWEKEAIALTDELKDKQDKLAYWQEAQRRFEAEHDERLTLDKLAEVAQGNSTEEEAPMTGIEADRRSKIDNGMSGIWDNGRSLEEIAHDFDVDPNELKRVDKIARDLGVKVRFTDNIKEGNDYAYGSHQKGLVTISRSEAWLGDRLITETIGHELGHYVDETDVETYNQLKDFAKKCLGDKWNEWTKERGSQYRKEQVEKEVVNDFLGSLFNDGKYLKQLAGEEQTMLERLYNSAVSVVYNRIRPKSLSAKEWKNYRDCVDTISKRLGKSVEQMNKDAKAYQLSQDTNAAPEGTTVEEVKAANAQAEKNGGTIRSDKGEVLGSIDNTGAVSPDFSKSTARAYRDNFGEKHEGTIEGVLNYMKEKGYDQKDIDAMRDNMNWWYDYMTRLEDFTDENGNLRFEAFREWNARTPEFKTVGQKIEKALSSLVTNGEYPINVELTTDCIKRESFTQLLNAMASMDNGMALRNMNPAQIIAIQNMMESYGIQTACKLCFVEGKRLGIRNWAETISDDWNHALNEALGLGVKEREITVVGANGKNEKRKIIDPDELAKALEKKYGVTSEDSRFNFGQGDYVPEHSIEKEPDAGTRELLRQRIENTFNLLSGRKGGVKSEHLKMLEKNANEANAKLLEMENTWRQEHPGEEFKPDDNAMKELQKIRNKGQNAIYKKMIRAIAENPELRRVMNINDLIGSKGLDTLRTRNGHAYEDLFSLIVCRFGSGTPKVVQQAQPYDGEIIKVTDADSANANAIGGSRMFSFSDFDIVKVFDIMQIYFDADARRLKLQSYSKEVPYILAFGQNTNAKINMSTLIEAKPNAELVKQYREAKGDKKNEILHKIKENTGLEFNPDGTIAGFQWSTSHSVSPAFAERIFHDDRYNANCGATTVGVSVNHTLWSCLTPWIRQVIPFHLSGMPLAARDRSDVGWYRDSTKEQNTRVIDDKGKWVSINSEYALKHHMKDFEFYAGEELEDGTPNPKWDMRQRCQDYVAWCDQKGYMPRFEWALNADNYINFCKQEGYEPNQQIVDAMRADSTKFTYKGKDGKTKEAEIFNQYYKVIADYTCYKPKFDEAGNLIGEEKAAHVPIKADFAKDQGTLDMLFEDKDSMLQNRENNIKNANANIGEMAVKALKYLKGEMSEEEMLNPDAKVFKNAEDSDLYLKRMAEQDAEPTNEAEATESQVSYSKASREKAEELDKEKLVPVYRAMQLIDGKLYPPMAAKQGRNLVEPIELGVWEQSDEHPELAMETKYSDGPHKGEVRTDENGNPMYAFRLNKGSKGDDGKSQGTVDAAYNPYIHTSRSLLNDQFSSAWKRGNLVVVKTMVPESELTSGYKAEKAKDAVGELDWKSGPVSGKLAEQGNPRKVILSRYDKPVEIVSTEKVADGIAEMLKGTNIEIPYNTVNSTLRDALVERGVKIGEPENSNAGRASLDSYNEWKNGVSYSKNDRNTNYEQEITNIFNTNDDSNIYSIISVIKNNSLNLRNMLSTSFDLNGERYTGIEEIRDKLNALLNEDIKRKHNTRSFISDITDSGFSWNTYKNNRWARIQTERHALSTEERDILKEGLDKCNEELAYRDRLTKSLKSTYNIDSENRISLDELKRYFNNLNSDDVASRLFDKVYEQISNYSHKFNVEDKSNGYEGAYYPNSGKVAINLDYFVTDSNNQNKAVAIIHELIHSCTCYAIDLYNNPLTRHLLNKDTQESVKELLKIYESVDKAYPEKNGERDHYGAKDVYEMVAETPNSEFRSDVSKLLYDENQPIHIREKIKAAIDKLLFKDSNIRNKEVGNSLENYLNTILDNYDERAFKLGKVYSLLKNPFSSDFKNEEVKESDISAESEKSYSLHDRDNVDPFQRGQEEDWISYAKRLVKAREAQSDKEQTDGHGKAWGNAYHELKYNPEATAVLKDTSAKDINGVASEVLANTKLLWNDKDGAKGAKSIEGLDADVHKKFFPMWRKDLANGVMSVDVAAKKIVDECQARGITIPEGDNAGLEAIKNVLNGSQTVTGIKRWNESRAIRDAYQLKGDFDKARDEEYQQKYGMSYDEYVEKNHPEVAERRRWYEDEATKMAKKLVELNNAVEKAKADKSEMESTKQKLMDYIQGQVNAEWMPYVGKRELNKLLVQMRDVETPEQLEQAQAKVLEVAAESAVRYQQSRIDKLWKLPVQGRNEKGMSVAKNVDDRTRQIMQNLKKSLNDSEISGLEETASAVRRERADITKELKLAQKQLDEADDAHRDDARKAVEELQAEHDKKTQELNAIQDEIWNRRAENETKVNATVEEDLQKLDQKQQDAAAGKAVWRDSDTDKVTELTVRKMFSDAAQSAKEARDMQREIIDKEQEIEDLKKDYKDGNITKEEFNQAKANAENDINSLRKMISQAKMSQAERLSYVEDELSGIISNGHANLKARIEAQVQHRNELLQHTYEAIKSGKHYDTTLGDNIDHSKGDGEFFRQPLYSFDYMVQKVCRSDRAKEGFLYKYFMESDHGVVKAQENKLVGIEEATHQLDDKVKEIFGKGSRKGLFGPGAWMKLAEESDKIESSNVTLNDMQALDENGVPTSRIKWTTSKGAAMYVYMVWKMEDGKIKLEKQGFDEQSIAEIKDYIGDDYVKLADWIQETFLPEKREKYNAKHIEMYNTSMAKIDNYVPLKINQSETRQDSNLEGTKNGAAAAKKLDTKAGSLINRTFNLNGVNVQKSAFDVISENINEMEDWCAFVGVRKDLDTLLTSNHFMNQLDTNYAGDYQRFKEAAAIATNAEPAEKVSTSDVFWSNVTRGVVGANITFRVATAIKQLLSYPAYIGYTGDPKFLGSLLKNTGKSVFYNNMKWCYDNMPTFKQRVDTGDLGNNRLSEDLRIETAQLNGLPRLRAEITNRWANGISKASAVGMIPNRFIDALTCSMGIKAIYDYEMEKAKKYAEDNELEGEELSEYMANADENARRQADMFYNATQQSSQPAFLSKMQTSKNLLAKAYSAYQNSNIAYTRMMILGAKDIQRDIKFRSQLAHYTNKYLEQGMTEDEARSEARVTVVKNLWGDVKHIGVPVLLKYLWMVGGAGLYGFLSINNSNKDDDERQPDESLEDYDSRMRKELWAGSLSTITQLTAQGLPGSGLAVNALDAITGKTSNFDANPLLGINELTSMTQDIIKAQQKYGLISPEVAGRVIYRASRFSGVDIQSLANIYLGVEGLINDGHPYNDWMVDALLMINLAPSQRRTVARTLAENSGSIEEYANRVALADGYLKRHPELARWLPWMKGGDWETDNKELNKLYDEWNAIKDPDYKKKVRDTKDKEREVKGLQTIEQAKEAYDTETDQAQRDKIAGRLVKFVNEYDNKKGSLTEQAQKRYDKQTGAKESKEPKKYDQIKTSNDVINDAKLAARVKELKKVWDHAKNEKDSKKQDEYMQKHANELVEFKTLTANRSAMNRVKKAMQIEGVDASDLMKTVQDIRDAESDIYSTPAPAPEQQIQPDEDDEYLNSILNSDEEDEINEE